MGHQFSGFLQIRKKQKLEADRKNKISSLLKTRSAQAVIMSEEFAQTLRSKRIKLLVDFIKNELKDLKGLSEHEIFQLLRRINHDEW